MNGSSGLVSGPPLVVHLMRNRQYWAAWCGQPFISEPISSSRAAYPSKATATDHAKEATCPACLRAAADFGRCAVDRMIALDLCDLESMETEINPYLNVREHVPNQLSVIVPNTREFRICCERCGQEIVAKNWGPGAGWEWKDRAATNAWSEDLATVFNSHVKLCPAKPAPKEEKVDGADRAETVQ